MKLAALLLLAGSLAAAPITVCPPDFLTDANTVDPGCPGITTRINAVPGSLWRFSWEDISFATQAGGDQDFNDWFGTLAVNALGTSALVTYGGALAGRWNTLTLYGVDLFATNLNAPGDTHTIATTPGLEIPFGLRSADWVLGTFTYQMGTLQDWAVCDCPTPPVVVPEPGAALPVGLVLLLGGLWMTKRRRA